MAKMPEDFGERVKRTHWTKGPLAEQTRAILRQKGGVSDETRRKINDKLATDETRRKMSESHKGKKHSQEQIDKMRKANTERRFGPLSDEIKQIISRANKGRKLSDETKRKIGDASRGNQYALDYKHTDETREKISRAGKGHPPYSSGNTDWYDYIDYLGKLNRVLGPYELRVAQYLDDLGLDWILVNTSHEHSFLLSNDSRYHADFYLPQLDIYIDPKGWYRDPIKYDLVKEEYPGRVKFLVGDDYLAQLEELISES